VGPEREVRRDAAVPPGEPRDHLAPQIAVHQEPVDEQEGRAFTGLPVAESALGELDLADGAECR
jgi:hypothetical protein